MKQTEIYQLKEMYAKYNNQCFVCGNPATNRAHLIGQGLTNRGIFGNHIIDNPLDWLPSCNECNDLIDVGRNDTAERVALIIESQMDVADKRNEIELIVRDNIERKQGKIDWQPFPLVVYSK